MFLISKTINVHHGHRLMCCWKRSKRKEMAFVKLSSSAHSLTFNFVFAVEIKKSCETCLRYGAVSGFCLVH